MSLFDFIENEPDFPQLPTQHQQNPPQSKPQKLKGRPEKLTFLNPCPLCEGRRFVCNEKGGFFCVLCHPEATGSPVIAGGDWFIPETPTETNEIDQGTLNSATIQPPEAKSKIKERKKERVYFDKAFPWIMGHIEKLQQCGWTKPELFRRSTARWPTGSWGVAWLPVWYKPDLQVEIDHHTGTIRFTFTGTHGEQVTQAAYQTTPRNQQ